MIVSSCTQKTDKKAALTFEQQVEDYFQKFPYQDTCEYVLKYTGGGNVYLSEGPVKLSASEYDANRFYSFQLMDDRNVNFRNIICPDGDHSG